MVHSKSSPREAPPMERASRVLRKASRAKSILDDTQTLEAVWPVAVGQAIARHVFRLRLVRKTLVVEVEDAVWQRQLRALDRQILDRLNLLLPDMAITEMEFRVGVPRRQVQRAESASGAANSLAFGQNRDYEAEQIKDPVLKKVYQLSRRKAPA